MPAHSAKPAVQGVAAGAFRLRRQRRHPVHYFPEVGNSFRHRRWV
jgi:hypothetical protein